MRIIQIGKKYEPGNSAFIVPANFADPAHPLVDRHRLTAPQTSNTPLGKIHQHLRGRYILTVALAGMFAIAGGAAGFFLPRPAYQSMGTIEVKPFIVSPELYDKVMPMYQQY